MDSLTQIVLGASVGEAVLGKKVGNKAMLWGAVAGTIPDLDVIANFFVDPIVANDIHRGFSHSILFSVLMSPILGRLINKIHKKADVGWNGWSKLAFWSLFTHPLLDCHTAYGTQLFWPFEYRVAYNNIFVADPLYTVPFLLLVLVVMFFNRNRPTRKWLNYSALAISSLYMIFTLISKWVAFKNFEESLADQKIEFEDLNTRPTPLNSLLWVSHVYAKDTIYVGFYSILDDDNDVEFFSFPINMNLGVPYKDEPIMKSIIRQSQGSYFYYKDEDKLYFTDIRFGPMSLEPTAEHFVYTYEIGTNTDGFYATVLNQRPKNPGKILKPLFNRIFNK